MQADTVVALRCRQKLALRPHALNYPPAPDCSAVFSAASA
ncbi:hypothetical protein I553_2246 [Mycobacterium xenopi 4042]|uniref:Uncharacterized protein n=1 Tax=Mycobacterium xenopi 4042 TaxID=1299334 RepID=X8DMV8_MYCXE|nr:hypothetical protein I552_6996 [Mycobacterium xenopi 3993]EUA69058.1 hypothetical protein I553_2246 [Mycobacterium xenopi 4042]